MKGTTMSKLGLYIHIPFCVKKCDYCDFLSFGGAPQRTKDRYIESLCNELRDYGTNFEGERLSTVYIGGGTPSVLSVVNFGKLMDAVRTSFVIEENAEVTIEMNPGTVTDEKMRLYVNAGINRVSMGLQSDDDRQLQALGRIHTFEMYRKTFELVRRHGIRNINVDVMFGLHEQTMEQWQHTLKSVVDLNPEHISAYSLIIEKDTPYEIREQQGTLNLPDEDTERCMFWFAHQYLSSAGYDHYEISNYAKPGKASRHNSSYWDLTPYIGAGLGASSYYGNRRYRNITSMDAYLTEKGRLNRVRLLEQVNTPETSLEEAFFLGLRCLEGVDLMKLRNVYGNDLMAAYDPVIEMLTGKGLLIEEGDFLRLTHRGVDLSNQVMSEFIL